RLSAVIGTPAVDQTYSRFGQWFSRAATACAAKLSPPALAARFAAAFASRSPPTASTIAPGSALPPPPRPVARRIARAPALGKQTQSVAIPPQQLDQIAAAAAKAKHVTRERILPESRLRLRRQTVEPLAHVGDAGCQPHPSARRQTIHRS